MVDAREAARAARGECGLAPAGPLRRALSAVKSDPTATYTLTTLAQTAGISVRHLTRTFAAKLGTTPTRVTEDHRIELARRLLLTDMTVTEVIAQQGPGVFAVVGVAA